MPLLDPSKLISNAVTNMVKSAVLVGLPTADNPVPNFCLLTIEDEDAMANAKMPASVTPSGEFNGRTVIEPSEINLSAWISEDDTSTEAVRTIQTVLTSLATLTNSFASFGGVLPNLSSLSFSFINSQIASLVAMKNNRQPIMLLGAYFSLGSLQQQTPYLLSKWYIQSISSGINEPRRGVNVKIRLREQLEHRDSSFLTGGLKAIMGEIGSPLAGQLLGGIPAGPF